MFVRSHQQFSFGCRQFCSGSHPNNLLASERDENHLEPSLAHYNHSSLLLESDWPTGRGRSISQLRVGGGTARLFKSKLSLFS